MLLTTYKRKHGLSRFSGLKFSKLVTFPGTSPFRGRKCTVSSMSAKSLGIGKVDHVRYFFITPARNTCLGSFTNSHEKKNIFFFTHVSMAKSVIINIMLLFVLRILYNAAGW